MELQSNIERISPVECRLTVEIPWSEISPRLETKMRDFRRRARLPGFRPGKIPPQVAEKMFGKSIREDLANDLVQETFPTAVAEHDTTPLTQPVVESGAVEKGKDFSYAARFEVPPEVQPKDYVGVEVRRRPAVVKDEALDAELERLQKDLTELRPLPEDPGRAKTQLGDVWTVDVDGTIGEQRISRKDLEVAIGEEDTFLPGLTAALSELELSEVGVSKSLTFTPPSEAMNPELRDLPVTVTVGIRDVRVKHIPELDDDFARDTGDAESLDELKGQIRSRLLEEDATKAENEARQRLLESLLERNPFDAAPSMIHRETTAHVDNLKRQLRQQGLDFGALGTSEQEYAVRVRPQAIANVKGYLLLQAIAKAESLEVSDDDLDAELAKMAEESGQNLQRMRAMYEKSGQLNVIRVQLREQRTLDFLIEKAVVTEAPDPEPESDEDETTSAQS